MFGTPPVENRSFGLCLEDLRIFSEVPAENGELEALLHGFFTEPPRTALGKRLVVLAQERPLHAGAWVELGRLVEGPQEREAERRAQGSASFPTSA